MLYKGRKAAPRLMARSPAASKHPHKMNHFMWDLLYSFRHYVLQAYQGTYAGLENFSDPNSFKTY